MVSDLALFLGPFQNQLGLGMTLSLVVLGGFSHDVPFLKYEHNHVKDSVAEYRVGHMVKKKVGCKIS